MNKEYIESLLREEEMVNIISKLRTQFSSQMTESNFFKIFIEAFKYIGIEVDITDEVVPFVFTVELSKFDITYCIRFNDNGKYLSKRFRHDEIQNKLKEYNTTQEGKGMLKSAHDLIDIFIGLLE